MASSEPDWAELQRRFLSALELPAGERDAYLRASCDARTRELVVGLLRAHESEGYLEAPVIAARREEPRGVPSIEGFEIVRELGRGGMGVVFEARQRHPDRVVALKVLRSSGMSHALLRRFEHEAHLLGRLQHPGIAQVHVAGTFDSGDERVPYFAMELVRGQALDAFVEQSDASERERLVLLAKIAEAVHHAHTKGVVHRDLKPANILVTSAGEPKILDFGVARATDVDVKLTTLRTDLGQLIGTLAYMSPEQTGADPSAVDSRSDVYALGVIGYELFAGKLPYEVRGKPMHEAVRIIQEEEPRRLGELDKRYRGDVETILAKALEKDCDRRYAGANELAADVRRHLGDEPIVARPASRAYQLSKFARRNRSLAAAVAAIALVLVVASFVSTLLAVQRASALRTATDARAEAERRERIAVEVRRFLEEDVLAQADPMVNLDRDLSVAQALENAAARLDGKFADEPAVEYSLRSTLGTTLSRLSRTEQARPQAQRALALARQIFGADSLEARSAHLSLLVVELSGGAWEEVVGELEQLLADTPGGSPEEELLRVRVSVALGEAYQALSLTEEATRTFEQVLEQARDVPDFPERERWLLRTRLGQSWKNEGRYAAAEELIRELLVEQREELGPDDPHTLVTANALVILLLETARLEEAESVSRDLVERCERVFGAGHNSSLSNKTVLATILRNQGRFDEALAVHRAKLEIQKRAQGETAVDTLTTQQSMASILLRMERFDEAEELARATLTAQLETLGERSYFTMHTMGTLASIHQARGQTGEAEELFRALVAVSTDVYGREHAQTASWVHNLGVLYEESGRFDEAAELLREAARINAEIFDPLHLNVLTSNSTLAGVLAKLGQLDEAEALYARTIDEFAASAAQDHWIRALALVKYAQLLHRHDGRREEALALAREGATILEATFGGDHAHTAAARAVVLGLQSPRSAAGP